MSAIAQRSTHLQAATVGLMGALSALSVTTFAYQGSSAGYAILWMGFLVLGLLTALVWLRPLVALTSALIFMTSPFALLLSLQWSALISALFLGGAILGFVLRTELRSMTRDPLFGPIGFFAGYATVSAIYGLRLGNPVAYALGDFFQVSEFAVVYFLVVQLLKTREQVLLVLRILLVSVLVTIFVELVLFGLGPNAGNLLPSWEGSSVSEAMVRTIDIDATIVFAVLINLYPVARSRAQRFWIWAAMIPTVANIALSLSRGLWLCTLVAALVSAVLQGRHLRKRLLLASALIGACLVLLATTWKLGGDSQGSFLSVIEERMFHGVDQVQEGLAGTESMATRRFLEVAIVTPQVLAKPWIGYGLGATYVIGGFAVLDAGTDAMIDHHFIHNLYLVTAFRMGLIGLALLLWIVLRYFRRILRACNQIPAGLNKALIIGLIASVVGQLFLSITQPTVIDHPTCALIAGAMALSCRLAQSNGPNLAATARAL